MKAVTKLNSFFDEELQSDIKDILITRDSAGNLTMFGEYSIVHSELGHYIVKGKGVKRDFSTIRNAIAFVTLLHSNKYREADRIQFLDTYLCSTNLQLAISRNILKSRTDEDSRLIQIIKIQEHTIKKRRIIDEIKLHINSSIRIQERKFEDHRTPKFRHF